jgi:hypothetical protein
VRPTRAAGAGPFRFPTKASSARSTISRSPTPSSTARCFAALSRSGRISMEVFLPRTTRAVRASWAYELTRQGSGQCSGESNKRAGHAGA